MKNGSAENVLEFVSLGTVVEGLGFVFSVCVCVCVSWKNLEFCDKRSVLWTLGNATCNSSCLPLLGQGLEIL